MLYHLGIITGLSHLRKAFVVRAGCRLSLKVVAKCMLHAESPDPEVAVRLHEQCGLLRSVGIT